VGSASISSAPLTRRITRVTSKVDGSFAHERVLAFAFALIVAGIAFEPRIRVGGFNADDWADYASFKFPQTVGFHSALGALENAAGSRVGHMLYWFVSFSLFGSHAKLYAAMAALLAAFLAFSVYMLLRELRFSIGQSLAMMVLTIVAPSVETMRFWFTVGGLQICLALFFLGLTLALRAFVAPDEQRRRLHAVSWVLYLASAVYAETALPLMAVCILVYLTRANVVSSLRRWAFDMAIVVVGYVATLQFVNSHAGFGKLPSSMWLTHANLIAGQTLTIFTKMLGPVSTDDRTLGLAGVGVLATACFVLWRRGNLSANSRRELQRWGFTFLVCLAAIIAIYTVFVPAMLYYEPLGLGLATHINSATAAPLAIGIFAVLMLAKVVCVELFSGLIPRVGYVAMAWVVAWYAVIAIGSLKDVRSDAHIWALASARDYHVLHVLTTDLPRPVHNATVYTFGEAGTVALGMPIFYTSWEQNSAVKVAYDRSDLSSYPMVAFGLQPTCTAKGVTASVESTVVNAPSPYGQSYFLDVPSGRYERIDSVAACTAALPHFQVGPYVIATPLKWSL
jgi:hypothetical protein